MKKIYLILFALSTFACCEAQTVTIPDANFVSWLKNNGFSSCLNGNQLNTSCSAVSDVKIINCSNSSISDLTGIQYFKNLDTLICAGNNIDTVPILPASLKYLDCSGNEAANIRALPSSLTFLDCADNQFFNLPPLPSSLLYLICSYNYNLAALPGLDAALLYLDCSNNSVIASLPKLSASLVYLDCSNNMLSALPALPSALAVINCSNNQISMLPNLPSLLDSIDCSYNQIIGIPALPQHITYIEASQNQLTSLPTLPDSLYYFSIHDNPQLMCMPVVNKITYLYWANTSIFCFPDFGTVNFSQPLVTSSVLCTTFNPNNCTIVNSIQPVKATETLNLFPNPTSGDFTINFSGQKGNFIVEIVNVLGAVVYNQAFAINENTLQIKTGNNLAPGMYEVRISPIDLAGQKQFTQKLVVE